MTNLVTNVASRFLEAGEHRRSVALMKFLSGVANRLGVGNHVYVVGGAVRDFLLERPIKDIDVVIDSVALGGKKDSAWFAEQLRRFIPTSTSLATNQYGVAILTVSGSWVLDGEDLKGEVIEVANARKESYGGGGYKPDDVVPATIEEDIVRRELNYNTLMWRLLDLTDGPEKAEVIDLTGCGVQDLRDGVMRCPADPDTVFSDDPSRMVRVIKFAVRYGHRLTPDTRAAILRNADKLKNVPSSHLSKLISEIVLGPKWEKSLTMMADLGLLAPVRELLLVDEPFRTTLQNHVNASKMDMMFGLMDIGLPLGARVQFLTPDEQARLREITSKMERDEAWEFLGMLKSPGAAFQNDKFQPWLLASFGVQKRDVGAFFGVVSRVTRGFLLDDPGLVAIPSRLAGMVRDAVGPEWEARGR